MSPNLSLGYAGWKWIPQVKSIKSANMVVSYNRQWGAEMNSSNKFGVEIAKDVFQFEARGKIHSEQVKRVNFLTMFVNQKPSLITMEACSGSHPWARELGRMGHEVLLITGHKAKPFVTGNNNHALDAKAIHTAMQQLGMRFENRSAASDAGTASEAGVAGEAQDRANQCGAWIGQ